jgi:molecular chaperone HtpG
MEQIKFQIETEKILNLLTSEIYDSPYALLRENVQNAYDAILMRKSVDKTFLPRIDISLNGDNISITDNGIGMSKDTIKNNFWKAGASGKNTPEARKAGVVGTFGIGAMANFGISSYLKVESHLYGDNKTIISDVKKENISVSEDCININIEEDNKDAGTKVTATLNEDVSLNITDATNYLKQYVQYLNIPIYLNGTIISQKEYFPMQNNKEYFHKTDVNADGIKFNLQLFQNGTIVSIYLDNLFIGNNSVYGNIYLTQNQRVILGLRNYFGLAQMPINTIFNFGGIVNLSILHPTAGREAISRESIQIVSQIITASEKILVEEYSKYDICDSNPLFLQYIFQQGLYNLAGKIKIQSKPTEEFMQLENISRNMNNKEVLYYKGTDKAIIQQYANENSVLLLLSRDTPRHQIQQYALLSKGIQSVPDEPTIIKILDESELSTAEIALKLRVTSIMKDDYFLNAKVLFAEISHNIPNMVKLDDETLIIYLTHNSGNISQLLSIYEDKETWIHFESFVKDYIRNQLYPKFSMYVPSSTREGADALYRVLQQKRELFTIDRDEYGEIENLIKDYAIGKIGFNEVLKVSASLRQQQQQVVHSEQIGSVEQELSPIINTSAAFAENAEPQNVEIAAPPILNTAVNTNKKILRAVTQYSNLNNNMLFLGLSDNLYDRQGEFFYEPHTTKVIWGMHKIIYIFTHISNTLTLYYDIELKTRYMDIPPGGKSVSTTTIITKNRIFVPVIAELISCFELQGSSLSFHVRYDLIPEFDKG